MSWGAYVILILLGIFVLLLILNPCISCFGRTLSSPFYPLIRKKRQKRIKTEDYGFHLVDQEKGKSLPGKKAAIKTEDYGFNLTDDKEETPPLKQK